MKKQIILIVVIVLGFAAVWWAFIHHIQKSTSQTTPTINPPFVQKASSSGTISETNSPPSQRRQLQSNQTTPKETISNDVLEYIQKLKEDHSYEWKLPINFYGQVVNESNEPIANADVHFGWNAIDEKGIIYDATADTKSDALGGFSLRDKKGDPLEVAVAKQGYYPRNSIFWYRPDRGPFKPDQNNPVVFHLHKRGPGTDLITSQYGMSPDFPIHIPRDGTPVKVDFLHRSSGDQGQMQIVEHKPEYANWKQATNWVYKIEIPDGGFIGENDEFPFEAAEEGYQSVVEFDFQKDNPDWTTDIKTNFYIKFGNPPLYGRLEIQTGISYGGAILTYAINPTGSRNLEPK
jgi:hypothetical protein